MYVGGCDVGSVSGEAVVLKDGQLESFSIVPSTPDPGQTAHQAMGKALEQAGLCLPAELEYVVATGYGRLRIPFAQENVSEITCHAKATHWICPCVRTVVDVGGQDCKVISIDDRGRVLDFSMNDRCASGTGRFFEAMARVLGCTLEELSALSLNGAEPAVISSQCSVFAESEVITLIHEGRAPANIAAGLHRSVASRLSSMVQRMGGTPEVTLTGGCAKNQGLGKALAEQLGMGLRVLPLDPQAVGALGAALLAQERTKG